MSNLASRIAAGRSLAIQSECPVRTTFPALAGPGETIVGTNERDILFGTAGDDWIRGLKGEDVLVGYASGGNGTEPDGDDTLDGGGGDDSMVGGTGADLLLGGNKSDSMGGMGGRDTLEGGEKDDFMGGGPGGDKLIGGGGADHMGGAGGHDRFIYKDVDPENDSDIIVDFTQGEDHIVLKRAALDADGHLGFIGTGEFSAQGQGEIAYSRSSTLSVVIVDVDGNGTTDIRIFLSGDYALTAEDFIAG